MRKMLALVCLVVLLPLPSGAQQQAHRETPRPISVKTAVQSTPSAAEAPTPGLPVRRVVLYKNGVGYFEHIGRVNPPRKAARGEGGVSEEERSRAGAGRQDD